MFASNSSFRKRFCTEQTVCSVRCSFFWVVQCAVLGELTLCLATAPIIAQRQPSRPLEKKSSSGWDSNDWPQFLGANSDGKSIETNVGLPWPTAGPPVAWSRKLGESYAIGTVAGMGYYQPDFRDGQSQLSRFNRETGKTVWTYRYSSNYVDLYNYSPGPRTSPVLDRDGETIRVYFYGVDGQLACLDASDGTRLWSVDTSKEFGVIQNFFGVGSTPVIYGDLLLTMVGGSPESDRNVPPGQLDRVQGNGSGIVAFDKRTGKIRYRLSDDLASYASLKVVQRNGRDWCFALMRGGLLVFNPADGTEDFYFPWRAKIRESVNASNPVVWDDYVFISETYGPGSALLKFRPDAHQVVWSDKAKRRDKSMQTHWNTSIYHQGYLYGSSGRHSNNAELRCIEALTGKLMWAKPGLARASLMYVKNHFVCLSEDGTLRLLRANPKQYDLVREFIPRETDGSNDKLLKYPAWAAPVLSHGLLYVRGRDRVVCYDLRNKRS